MQSNGIGSCRRKQVTAKVVASIFAKQKKAFFQTVTILSENVLFCFEKQHEIEQIVVDQILGQVDEELSEAESEFSTEG